MSTAPADPAYFRDYWDRTKERHNASRREKYRNDPNYRAIVLARNHGGRMSGTNRGLPEETVSNILQVPVSELSILVASGALAPPIHTGDRGRMWEPGAVLEAANKRRGLPPEEDWRAKGVTRAIRLADGSSRRERLYRMQSLSAATGRSAVSLETLEKTSVLPETPLRGEQGGHRYYTAPMIDAVKKAFKDAGGERLFGKRRKAIFLESVTLAWKALGLAGAQLEREA